MAIVKIKKKENPYVQIDKQGIVDFLGELQDF